MRALTADLRDQLAKAEDARDRLSRSQYTDPALARVGPALLKQMRARDDARMRTWIDLTDRIESLRHRLALAEARDADKERVRLTAADVAGARLVRDRHGWHKVVRVSAKSVTVETGYSWTDRISIDKILGVEK